MPQPVEFDVIVKCRLQYYGAEGRVYLNPEPTGLALQTGESEAALNSPPWQPQ